MSKDTAGVILAKTVEQTASSVNNVVQSVSHSESVQSLDNALAQMITSVVGGIKEGVSFVQGQLPDVIMQLVVYNRVLLTTYIVFGILLIPFIIWLIRKGITESKKKYSEISEGMMVVSIIGSIAGVFASCIIIGANFSEFLKIWFAPKVWLIEYAAELVKKVS